MAAYTIEADLELFTEADNESLEFKTEDLEEKKTYGYGNGNGNGYARRISNRSVNRRILKTFTSIVKALVKKIMSNPKTRTKLQAAVRQGPNAVTRLIMPSVTKALPSYFRWMVPIYVPAVTLALFDPIRKQLGVKAEEVKEAPEFLPLLIGVARIAAQVAARAAAQAAANRHRNRRR